jgi:hypothetical protein
MEQVCVVLHKQQHSTLPADWHGLGIWGLLQGSGLGFAQATTLEETQGFR